jgi:fatty acid desaturase
VKRSRFQPIAHAAYVARLRERLPEEAFERTPERVLDALPHLLVFLAAAASPRFLPTWALPFVALIAGHSLVCILFIAHDLSHGSVLAPSPLRRLLELLFWGLNLVPVTLWRRVHNDTHHVFTGTTRDPDRPFLPSERSRATVAYDWIFYPGRDAWLRWNPLTFVHFLPYVLRNVLAAFLPAERKPAFVPAVPHYTLGQRLGIVVDLAVIVALQAGIFRLAGTNWSAYLWVGPVAAFAGLAVLMLYVSTNHFTDPITAEPEPLLGTTSLKVPRWMDLLHGNFSHHVEHHLFPAMSSRHFPLVRAAILAEFPERYNCLTLGEAWRALAARESWSTVTADPSEKGAMTTC